MAGHIENLTQGEFHVVCQVQVAANGASTVKAMVGIGSLAMSVRLCADTAQADQPYCAGFMLYAIFIE